MKKVASDQDPGFRVARPMHDVLTSIDSDFNNGIAESNGDEDLEDIPDDFDVMPAKSHAFGNHSVMHEELFEPYKHLNEFSSVTFGGSALSDDVAATEPYKVRKNRASTPKGMLMRGGLEDDRSASPTNEQDGDGHTAATTTIPAYAVDSLAEASTVFPEPPSKANAQRKKQSNSVKFRKIRIKPGPEPIAVRLQDKRSVESQIAKESKNLSSVYLQRQLKVLSKANEDYKKENETLSKRLGESHVEEVLQKFREALKQRDEVIINLRGENMALKQIERHQTKYFMDSEIKKHEQKLSGAEDGALTQDKQIEILMEHIKKQNAKMATIQREERLRYTENEKLKKRNQKLRRQVLKLTDSLEINKLLAQQRSIREERSQLTIDDKDDDDQAVDIGDSTLPEISKVIGKRGGKGRAATRAAAAMLEANARTIERQKEVIATLERSTHVLRSGLEREVSQMRTEAEESRAAQQRLEVELDKREANARYQIIALRQLRQAYEQLLEGSTRLGMSSDLFERDTAGTEDYQQQPAVHVPPSVLLTPPRTPSPPSRPPTQPPPTVRRPVVAQPCAKGPKTGLISDESQQSESGSTVQQADLTFLTTSDI